MLCKVGTKDCGFDLIVPGEHSKHWSPCLSAGADISRETLSSLLSGVSHARHGALRYLKGNKEH